MVFLGLLFNLISSSVTVDIDLFYECVAAASPLSFHCPLLPVSKWSVKVSRGLEVFVNMAVSRKFFAVVKVQCFHPGSLRFELVHNG